MHIQKIFVILAFNNQLLESAISLITKIPAVGVKLEDPVRKLLGKTKKQNFLITLETVPERNFK